MTQLRPGSVDADQNPLLDQRRPDRLARHFRDQTDHQRAASARKGLWVAVLVYLSFAGMDWLLLPDVAVHLVVARVAVAITALAIIETQVMLGARADLMDLTCAAALVCGYGGWLYPATLSSNIENLRYYMVFGTIFMMGANLFFGLHFLLSIVTSLAVLGAFFWALLAIFGGEWAYTITFGAFFVSCLVFTSYVNWSLNRERLQVFLNAQEARKQNREATERGKALLRLSNTDYLTGVENRRAIDQRLRDYWDAWQDHGASFAGILVDVDFFKKYNDCYGHQAGDHCLVLVANALREALIPFNASLGRYGGEEFIVLAPVGSREGVIHLSEVIRSTVEQMGLVHDQRRDGLNIVTVSVGAAFTRRQQAPKLEKIITEADRALYAAKASGRNCVKIFDPTDPQSSDDRESLAALLRVALHQKLVTTVYQPIIDVASGSLAGVETLMRFTMLDGTPISPTQFIPIAEQTGAIHELGLWSIRQACREVLKTGDARLATINVSPIQLKTRGFAPSVAGILSETGVLGHQLAFEITEGVDMDGQADIIRSLHDLEALGIKIWLDDFGTGFAGLSWLRLFNFDTVKIDKSFLQDSDKPRGSLMLQDIITLLRNRGHKILVEGIETDEQLALMRSFGIDQVQGFYIGRPMITSDLRARFSRQPALTRQAVGVPLMMFQKNG